MEFSLRCVAKHGISRNKLDWPYYISIPDASANILLSFVLLCMAVTSSVAATTTPVEVVSECRSLAIRIGDDTTSESASDRAHLLQEQSGKCSGTGLYDAKLAFLFWKAGLFDDADRAAQTGLPTADEFRPNLLYVLALDQLGRGHVDEAYRMGLDVARQYPKYAQIYVLLGQIDMQRHDLDKRLEHANKLVELDPSSLSYMVLATSLYQLKRYPEVIVSVNHALQIEPGRIADSTGLTEGIYALILLNRREEATDLLRRHMQANFNWKQSVPMVNAAKELRLIGR